MEARKAESQIERLERAMKARDMSWADLARALGTTSQRVGNWKKRGAIPANEAWSVAHAVGVSADWLIKGLGPQGREKVMLVNEDSPPSYADPHGSGRAAAAQVSRVPLILCAEAGNYRESLRKDAINDELEFIETSLPASESTFAVLMDSDSMAPKFPPGATLIVEPGMQAEPGDYVVARSETGVGTCKRLVQDAGRLYLKPENPQYPMLDAADYTIVGVVREVLMRLK
nr:S24 family peptidase [Thioalkalivibrio sp. ALJ8]